MDKSKDIEKMLPLERQIHEMQLYHRNYLPLEKRNPTPYEIFLKVSEEYHQLYSSSE